MRRRGFIFGLGATLAVVRTPGLLMPVKPWAWAKWNDLEPWSGNVNYYEVVAEWVTETIVDPKDPTNWVCVIKPVYKTLRLVEALDEHGFANVAPPGFDVSCEPSE